MIWISSFSLSISLFRYRNPINASNPVACLYVAKSVFLGFLSELEFLPLLNIDISVSVKLSIILSRATFCPLALVYFIASLWSFWTLVKPFSRRYSLI